MIVKSFALNKDSLKKIKYFLLYGNNKGFIKESIEKNIQPLLTNNIYRYDENEIVNDIDTFEESIQNQSFFENQKLIIISRATDRIIQIIEKIVEKDLDDISIILTSGVLEKKSKLRNFFEKNKKTICVPFYEDNTRSLNLIAQNFLRERKILLSQQNINLIIDRCSGDRINLYNELQKIESFSRSKKQIKTEDILRLTNLAENFNVSELIDNTLAKNEKKTLNILNENIFLSEDAILILRIFLIKLKRLLKIQNQLKNKKNVEEVIDDFKPPIFWKEKEIVKKQIKVLNFDETKELIIKTNKIELLTKKYPTNSINIVTNFIIDQAS